MFMNMTMAPEYRELHGMIDQLTLTQARALRSVVMEFVRGATTTNTTSTDLLADEPVRSLSFSGMMHGGPELAEQSEDILRSEFGQPT